MAYSSFAYWYDALNAQADYDRLAEALLRELQEQGITGGIVADLGCGTGEMTLRLAKAGYDMIAVDASPDMLSVFREKADAQGRGDILLLCQDLAKLDLYGTVRALVSTFDTFNHLDANGLATAMQWAALFTEPGGLLVFDMNTPYKHEVVLGRNRFEVETPDGRTCLWQNRYDPQSGAVHIELKGMEAGKLSFTETFTEYSYSLPQIESLLRQSGWQLLRVQDGESFSPPSSQSQRLLITAKKN